jgi:hypothetical protein
MPAGSFVNRLLKAIILTLRRKHIQSVPDRKPVSKSSIIAGNMGIHAGIHCCKCSRVHFLAALKRIPETQTKGLYQITCPPSCGATTLFRLEDMRGFSVADRLYTRGYAEPGEYEIVPRVKLA